ncbi:MAG TPA: type II secretion system protein [Phycisphaerae bacterium]|nr:type II secretion system protein [Phycisphaerae bacterium]
MASQESGRPSRGFTLVELLVVVGIIALLVTILMPSLSRAMELARRSVCAANQHAIGRGWQMYWQDNNFRTPNQFNPLPFVTDCYSQFNFMLYCATADWVDDRYPGVTARYEGTSRNTSYVNAGKLFETRTIADGRTYVCPTYERNFGRPWFDKDENPWPINRNRHTEMTYGTRRMMNYDDRSLANQTNHYDTRDDEIMIWSTGVQAVPKPGDFSWMADAFRMPTVALLSHVPGVNVLYLDGHVAFWRDETEKILYDNGLPTGWWDPAYNWEHDDIWMIIDGYHQPPVGQ